MARANGVEELLPYTTKGTEERIQRRVEHGLRVKGTGVGQKVKGKLWERTMKGRLEKRRQAMLGMPKLVQQWKQVSIHRIWQCCWTKLMMSTDGPRPWVEEMAQVTFFGGRDRILHKTSSRPHGQLQTLDVIEHRKAFQSVYSNSKRIA